MKINPDVIIDEISQYYGIDRILLKATTRKREIVKARHMSMLFIYIYSELTHEVISKMFNRKRPNVTHACKSVNNRCFKRADPVFKKEYDEIKFILTGKREPADDEIFMENDIL